MIKKIRPLYIIALLFLLQANYVFALELNYPQINGLGGPGATFTLEKFIQYVFIFIILSAGAIGVLAIAISGFQILMSFGSPAAKGAANERIRNAILGIILLVSSVLIFRTINPEFIQPTTGFAGLQTGVYTRHFVGYGNTPSPDGMEYKQAEDSMRDTSTLPSNSELFWRCTAPGRDLLVWVYGEKDFYKSGSETTRRITCNTGTSITNPAVYSYTSRRVEPGIYFYESEDCTGYSSEVYKASRNISFRNIKSLKIINGIPPNERYGVVLNREIGGLTGGQCSDPVVKFDPGEECYKLEEVVGTIKNPDGTVVDFDPFYAYIIKYNPDYAEFGSQTNVQIYSDNLFAKLDQKDSALVGPDSQTYNIGSMYIYPKYDSPPDPSAFFPEGNPDKLLREQFIWDNMLYTRGPKKDECCVEKDNDLDCDGRDPNTDPQKTSSGRSCISGLEINGSYYVFLYSRNTTSGSYMCQDFFGDWGDIPNQTHLLDGNREFYKFIIIPRR